MTTKKVSTKLAISLYASFIVVTLGGFSISAGVIHLKNDLFELGVIHTEIEVEKGREDTARYVYSLNPELYANIRKIKLKSNSLELYAGNLLLDYFGNFHAAGIAFQPTKTITLTRDVDDENFAIAHEICHFIYFDLNDFEKKAWKIEFDKPNTYYRNYSKYLVTEDFADYCGLYILYNIPKVQKFIEARGNTEGILFMGADIFWGKAKGRKNVLDNYFLRKGIKSLYM